MYFICACISLLQHKTIVVIQPVVVYGDTLISCSSSPIPPARQTLDASIRVDGIADAWPAQCGPSLRTLAQCQHVMEINYKFASQNG